MCTLTSMDNQCGIFKFDNETLKGILIDLEKESKSYNLFLSLSLQQGCIMTCNKDGCNRAVRSPTYGLSLIALSSSILYSLYLIVI